MKKLLVAGCALIVVCAALATAGAGAQPAIMVASPQFVTFGMVGLGTGQTARLNALALPVGGPIIAGSCQVTFDFYDDTGALLKTGTATVTQGSAVHEDLVSNSAARAEIRGTVRAAFVSASPATTPIFWSCPLLPTMEIFNTSSGQTTVVLQQTSALSLVTPL